MITFSILLCFILLYYSIFKDKLKYYIPLLYQYFLLLSKPYIPFKTEIFKHDHPAFIEYDVLSDEKYKSVDVNIPLRHIAPLYNQTLAKIKTKDNKSYLVYIIHTNTDKLLLNTKLSFKIVSVFNQNIYFNPDIISEFKYLS